MLLLFSDFSSGHTRRQNLKMYAEPCLLNLTSYHSLFYFGILKKWHSSAYTLYDCKSSGYFLCGSIYVRAPIEIVNVKAKSFLWCVMDFICKVILYLG